LAEHVYEASILDLVLCVDEFEYEKTQIKSRKSNFNTIYVVYDCLREI